MVKRWGQVVVPRLACLVKLRDDGSKRVRIIIDMLRSGLNYFIKLEERLVLPRLRDVVANLLYLLSLC